MQYHPDGHSCRDFSLTSLYEDGVMSMVQMKSSLKYEHKTTVITPVKDGILSWS